MRVAFFSPLPPARSGIADYSEALVKASATGRSGSLLRRPRTLRPSRFDIALYQIGNNGITALFTRRRCGIPASW